MQTLLNILGACLLTFAIFFVLGVTFAFLRGFLLYWKDSNNMFTGEEATLVGGPADGMRVCRRKPGITIEVEHVSKLYKYQQSPDNKYEYHYRGCECLPKKNS